VDFELSEDQKALQGLVRSIVAGRFPLERTRRAEEARQVVDADDWSALAEVGVFSLTLPTAAGGAGLTLADSAVVFEELGRGLVPGPLVATALAARAGVAGAADGATVVAEIARPGPGEPCLVAHLDAALAFLVFDGAEVAVVEDVDSLRRAARPIQRALDPLTPMSKLEELPTGAPLGNREPWRRHHRILTAAFCVGIAGATCDLAVAYARERRQFDRPIGAFQAVGHLCADMLVRTEVARAAVHAAAVNDAQPDVGDADRAAAGGALLGADAAILNSKACIQVHGGVGFTWDLPIHLYLMRARVLASSLGPPDQLAAEVAVRL